MKPILYILLAVCVFWRLCVPTVIDVSATSLCKDFAHLVVAFAFGWTAAALHYTPGMPYGWKLRTSMLWLFVAACFVSLFELAMALLTKGPVL